MSLRSTVVGQFRKPQGPLGQLAGFIMATRPSNRERNAWTVGLLRLEPWHTVLEIGCGPGLALKACAAQVTSGRVVGIDHSEAMVRQARRRLDAEIAAGIAEARVASLAEFAAEPRGYDRILSLNVVQFLPDMEQGFRQIHRCLAERGQVVTTFQPRSSRPTREQALDMARRIEAAMLETGYAEIERHELPLEPVPAICVSGVRPMGRDPVVTPPLPGS